MTWRNPVGLTLRQCLLTGCVTSVFALAACGDDSTDKSLTVVDPAADQELTTADDVDAETDGLQYDVEVTSSGLVEGTALRLLVDDKQVSEGEVGADGKTTFAAVTLEPGQNTIVAQTTAGSIASNAEQQYIYRLLRIASPAAGTIDEDADPTTDGMQIAITVEAFAIDGDVTLVVDGDEQGDPVAVTEGLASFEVTLSAGAHTLAAKSGEVTSAEVDINVVTACGAISLVSPKATNGRIVLGGSDGTCPAEGEPYMGTFEISTDAATGSTARLFVNDMMAASAEVSGALATFADVTLGMRTTASTLKVEIDTPEGVCSKTFTADVFVDCAGPDCEIISPVAYTVTDGSTTTEYLNSDIGDGTFGVEVASSADLVGRSVELIVDGNSADPLTVDAVEEGNAAKATFNVDLADGTHTVRARCVDAAGNATLSDTKDWTVDVTPCAVAITAPPSAAMLLLADDEDTSAAGTQILVSAGVSGSGCAEARASVCDSGAATGDYAAFASGTPFTVTLDDSMIDQSLCVEVRDVAGNVGSGSVDVQYFSAVPTLSILSPTDGAMYNTTGDDSVSQAFEPDVDTGTAGCQADFRVNCSEIGVPVELVRIPSNNSMSEVVLGTADCNAPTASDTDITSGGVAVFSSISFQNDLDPTPSYVARQTYVGDSGTQGGESAAIAITGQCTPIALAYSASLRKTGGGVTPLPTCPARVGTTGVTLDVTVDATPGLSGMVATLTASDATGAVTSTETANGLLGSFQFVNRGISVGSTPGMASVSVDVVDTFNNMATTTCQYNVSDSNLALTAAIASPPGTTTFTTTTPNNSACPNTDPAAFTVPVVLTADAESLAAPTERSMSYSVDGGTAVNVPMASSGSTICVAVGEGSSSIVARLDDTRGGVTDFDMQLVAVTVDTLNLTKPTDGATYSSNAVDGCAAGEIRVQGTVHPIYGDGETVNITTPAGTTTTTVQSSAINTCVAVNGGAQTVTVTIPSSGATQSAGITYYSDPSGAAVDLQVSVPSASSATYRTDKVNLSWTLPSGTFNFVSAELRCSLTDQLTAGEDAAAWWGLARPPITATSANRFTVTPGINPTTGTLDQPTGDFVRHCAVRLCDNGGRCTDYPSTSAVVDKPFRFVSVTDPGTAELIGRKVEPVGDVNGDGYDDVLVAASSLSDTDAAVYLYFGVADGNLPQTPSVRISMNVASESSPFGTAIAGIGDVNGDTIPDFAVGRPSAPGANVPVAGYGAAYVFFGRNQADPWPATIVLDDASCLADVCIEHDDGAGWADSLGASIVGLGDFDGAGNADFAIGAPATTTDGALGGGPDAPGGVYIVSGIAFPVCSDSNCSLRSGSTWGSTVTLTPDGLGASGVTAYFMEGTGLTGVGSFNPPTFGIALAGAGDADASGDGRNEVVIAAGGAQRLFMLTGRDFGTAGTVTTLTLTDGEEIVLPIVQPADPGLYIANIRMLANVFDPATATPGMPDLGVYVNSVNGLHVLAGTTTGGFSAATGNVMYIEGGSGSKLGSTIAGGMFPALPGIPEMDLDGDGEADIFLGSVRVNTTFPGGAFYFTGDRVVQRAFASTGTTGSFPHQTLVRQSQTGLNVAPPVLTTNAANTEGRSVQYVGDLTGDGVPDLVVGDLVNAAAAVAERKGAFHVLY